MKGASFQKIITSFAASPLDIFSIFAIFAKFALSSKIATLQGATFGFQFDYLLQFLGIAIPLAIIRHLCQIHHKIATPRGTTFGIQSESQALWQFFALFFFSFSPSRAFQSY